MVVVVLGWVVDVVVGCVVDVVGLVVVVVGITVVVVLGWVVDVVVGYVVVDVGIVVVVVLACVVDVVGYVVVVGFTVVVVLGWVVDVVVGQVHPVVVVGCPPPALAPVVGAPARSMIAPTERLTTPKIVRRRSVVAAAKNRATALSILRRAGAPKPDMRTFPFRSSGRAALWPPPLSSSSPLSQAHASNQESGEFHVTRKTLGAVRCIPSIPCVRLGALNELEGRSARRAASEQRCHSRSKPSSDRKSGLRPGEQGVPVPDERC